VASAWLESRPTSTSARRLLVGHLVGIGKPDEAVAIENGAEPEEVGTFSEKELARLDEKVVTSVTTLRRIHSERSDPTEGSDNPSNKPRGSG
jgi:hypothetical protein